jgi:hypothetical protein
MSMPAAVTALVVVLGIAPPQPADPLAREPASAIVRVTGSLPPKAPMETLSPEEKMQRRYPQPVKVGDLIGLPVLDDDDRTLGRIKMVVRTSAGKIQLIVPYGGFLGFRQRLIAVPIEVVAIAGRQLAALDMPRTEFDAAPAWLDTASQPIPANETIRIALYKR